MKYTNAVETGGFDFSKYELGEINAAITIVSTVVFVGPSTNNLKAQQLAVLIREKNLLTAAIRYFKETKHLAARVITPFNVQQILSEKFASYQCDERKLEVEKLVIPIVHGYPAYTGLDIPITSLLPGVKIVPFDVSFALSVSLAAAVTTYTVEKGAGRVFPITPPAALYPDAPCDGDALAYTFEPNFAGSNSLIGLDWANFLYAYFYEHRVRFSETVTFATHVPDDKCRTKVVDGNEEITLPKTWTKLYSFSKWAADRPRNPVQRVESLNRQQAYRSRDNYGISALTYGIYGEEFGSTYRLAEKMGNFEIFLKYLDPLLASTCPIRYISEDERELVSAQLLMAKYGFRLKHYHARVLNDVKPSTKGKYVYTDTVVYDPKCLTAPYSGKMKEEAVEIYIESNTVLVLDSLTKYTGCTVLGFRAHVLGLEANVIGMATPHNAVGVMVADQGECTPEQVWTTIMVASFVRNTYLYHRRPLSFFLDRIVTLNVDRKAKGLAPTKFMAWDRIRRPIWFAFTKEQRKKLVDLLRECEMFGEYDEHMNDADLVLLSERAQSDPKFQKVLMRNVARDQDVEADRLKVTYGGVSAPKIPTASFIDPGDDVEKPIVEARRPKLGTLFHQKRVENALTVSPAEEDDVDVEAVLASLKGEPTDQTAIDEGVRRSLLEQSKGDEKS